MTRQLTTIGFDADDTLWHNERAFRLAQARFAELLADFADPDHLNDHLLATERRNLTHYGFGVKGFVLSMIETAIEVTNHTVPARIISELVAAGQDMLSHPVALLPHSADAVAALAQEYRLVLITKGDLLDQERKLVQSGLGNLFDAVNIVSEKTPETYAKSFADDGPERALMVGNSMRSDILPALKSGAWAVHVPHDLVWPFEEADTPSNHDRFHMIKDLGALPGLVATLT